MCRKLILVAVVTFAILFAFITYTFDQPIEVRRFEIMDIVLFNFVIFFPLPAAVIIWLHKSSVRFKIWSLGIALITSLTIGSIMILDSFATADQRLGTLIIFVYCLIVSSGLVSLVGRLAFRLYGLLRFFIMKLKQFGRALPD